MTDLVAQLVGALDRLLNSDPDGAIATASEDELTLAANDMEADPVIREQAAAVLQARAALSAAKDGGWCGMESAPLDGTEVFVYVPGDSLFPTAAAYKSADYFEKEYGDREYMEEGWYWAFGYPSDFHECVIKPTAWRPLPNPPKDQS